MKKALNLLKSPLPIPIMTVGVLYLFCLFTASLDVRGIYDNFVFCVISFYIFGIYIFIFVIIYQGEKLSEWSFITIAISFAIYARWFQLIPSVLEENKYDSAAYIAGIALLGIYIILAVFMWFAKNNPILRAFLFAPTILVFCANLILAWVYFPYVSYSYRCNETTYYISEYRPLSDAQWSYLQLTKWKAGFNYESSFFGRYGSFEFICDEQNKQTNIINGYSVLVYSDGKNPHSFDDYASAQLGDGQYFLSKQCNDENCESKIYRLYECNLDYKSCYPLPIQYTGDSMVYAVLEADEINHGINLYNGLDNNLDRKLIFTYGEHPRCYVEGCKILKP